MNASELKALITTTLLSQGFTIDPQTGDLRSPGLESKEAVRAFHALSVAHKRAKAALRLNHHESELLEHFAEPSEISVDAVRPVVDEVIRGTKDELLFRYACLHWSIPVSSGYGRRLRFLVRDEQNGKLIGLIGLGDPVFSLGARDRWIGWSPEERRSRLRHVLDAFVLGAVPPYSHLLCGKLIAMLLASDEIQRSFQRKYGGRTSLISEQASEHPLVLITTLSALGKSSIYNRIKVGGQAFLKPVGYSSGYGDFHFANGTYRAMFEHVESLMPWTAKNAKWGTGSRNRREVIQKCLRSLGMDDKLLRHGIQREVYVAPLAGNARAFLQGKEDVSLSMSRTTESIFSEFRTRWWHEARRLDFVGRSFRRRDLALWSADEEDRTRA